MEYIQKQVCPVPLDEYKLSQLLLVLRENVINNDTLTETQKMDIYDKFQKKYDTLFVHLDKVNNANPYKSEVIDAVSQTKAQAAQAATTKETFIGGPVMNMSTVLFIGFLFLLGILVLRLKRF